MSDKVNNMIEQIHEKAICYDTKTLKIFGDIDKDMKDKVVSNLHILDQTHGEVTILLSTEGGCVTSGLEIIDAIRAMKNHVRIIAYGEVASMGSVIFQAADTGRRLMMPNSYLMLHEGDAELSGNRANRQAYKRLLERDEETCIKMYLKKIKEVRPRFTKKQLNDKLQTDWILFPKEAIEFGLADKILETY